MVLPLIICVCMFVMLMLGGIWLGYRVYYQARAACCANSARR